MRMKLSSEDKAMLITFGSASLLILAFFSLGVKPYQKPSPAETFIEIPVLREVEEERTQERKSRVSERIRNHSAYNTSQIQKDVQAFFKEEDAVRKAIEAQKLKSVRELALETQNALSKMEKEQKMALEKHKEKVRKQIEDRELKQRLDNAGAKRESTISYHLSNRSALYIPNPVYTCDNSGKIMLTITVSASGAVTKTSFNKKVSTSTNGCLIDQALAYAREALFSPSTTISQGSITFNFQN